LKEGEAVLVSWLTNANFLQGLIRSLYAINIAGGL